MSASTITPSRLISSATNLVSFSIILWGISNALKAPIFGVEIPGFLFWVAVLYAVVATGITQLIGRSLSKLYFRQQAVEANFRFDLARVREYSEQIALLKGEDREIERAGTVFDDVFRTIRRIIHVRTWLIAFNQFYSQISVIIPYVVVAPFYYAEDRRLRPIQPVRGRVRQRQQRDELLRRPLYRPRRFQLGDRASHDLRGFLRPGAGARRKARAASHGRSGKRAEPVASRCRYRAARRTQACAYRRSRADPAGIDARRRSFGRRQIDALPGDLGLVAVRLGRNPAAGLRQAHALAATALYSDRPVAGGARLSGGELEFFRRAAARRALSRSGCPRSSSASTKATTGRCGSRAASSSASPSRARCSRPPTGCSSTNRPPRSTKQSEADLYRAIAKALPNTTLVSIGHRSTLNAFHKRRIAFEPHEGAPATVVSAA